MLWASAVVIGRILAESGSPPPDVEDPAILLIKRRDVVVGCTPPPGDAGIDGDAADGGTPDGGLPDAGTPDAGPGDAGIDDGGLDDAGTPDAGTCTTIHGDAVTLIVQPHVTATGDGTRFAVLLVTPERPIVEVTSSVFGELARVTAKKIVEKTVEVQDPAMGQVCSGCGGGTTESQGCGGDFGDDDFWEPPGIGDAGLGDGGLVEEMVGPYQFVRAKPADASELAGWLDQLGYAYMQADLDAVAPYIALGYHVVALRVALGTSMTAALTPVALTWPGSELRVPAALGRGAVAPGLVTVYIAAEGAYAFPVNKIRYSKWTGTALSTGWLTRAEIMLNQNLPPEQDPIAFRTADVDVQEVETVTKEVRVPVEVVCDDGCCSECSATRRTSRVDLLFIVGAVAVALRRRRPARRSQR